MIPLRRCWWRIAAHATSGVLHHQRRRAATTNSSNESQTDNTAAVGERRPRRVALRVRPADSDDERHPSYSVPAWLTDAAATDNEAVQARSAEHEAVPSSVEERASSSCVGKTVEELAQLSDETLEQAWLELHRTPLPEPVASGDDGSECGAATAEESRLEALIHRMPPTRTSMHRSQQKKASPICPPFRMPHKLMQIARGEVTEDVAFPLSPRVPLRNATPAPLTRARQRKLRFSDDDDAEATVAKKHHTSPVSSPWAATQQDFVGIDNMHLSTPRMVAARRRRGDGHGGPPLPPPRRALPAADRYRSEEAAADPSLEASEREFLEGIQRMRRSQPE